MNDVDFAVGIDNVLDKTYTEHLNKLGVGVDGQVGLNNLTIQVAIIGLESSMKF